MTRAVHVCVPAEQRDVVVKVLRADERVRRMRVVECQGGKEVLVMFVCVAKHLGKVLEGLEHTGVARDFGSIDILAVQSSIPSLKLASKRPKRRKYLVDERRTVREIEDSIDSACHLTFDYIVFVCVASIIAAVGLVTDSAVVVVASMLVSPMMAPILAVSFGIAVGRADLVRIGLRNELWGIVLCMLIGTVAGAVSVLFFEPIGMPALITATGNTMLQSEQMESRGTWIGLLTGFCTAVPSGVGVALAMTNPQVSTVVVGVAIASAILPPLVNASLSTTIGIIYQSVLHDEQHASFFLRVGGRSLLLFVLNFATICSISTLTFRLKGVRRQELHEHGPSNRRSVAADPTGGIALAAAIDDESDQDSSDDDSSSSRGHRWRRQRRPSNHLALTPIGFS